MTVESSSFSKDRYEAAKRFVKSMVIIDDRATFEMPKEEEVITLQTPSRRSRISVREQDIESSTPVETIERDLYAKPLIDSAACDGVVCSVLRPDGEEETIVEKATTLAISSDIVSIDWEMDDDGQRCMEMIRRIIQDDQDKSGRLRLISIYTAKKQISSLSDRVLRTFSLAQRKALGMKKDQKDYSLKGDGIRIVFLIKAHGTKPAENYKELVVEEKDLPRRLIKEFSKISGGILSNVAMAAVGKINASIHHILKKYNENLDIPFLTHRSLLPVPEYAEDYGLQLVASELTAVLITSDVGEQFSGIGAIKRRIPGLKSDSGTFEILEKNNSTSEVTYKISDDAVHGLLEGGMTAAYKQFGTTEGDRKANFDNLGKNKFPKVCNTLFADSIANAQKWDREFTRKSTLAVDLGSLSSTSDQWFPYLRLGTVMQSNASGQYFVCLQPLCDSVRLTGEREFPFAPLELESKHPEFVVLTRKNGEATEIGLKLVDTPYELKTLRFRPTVDGSQVVKLTIDNNPYFKTTSGRRWNWMGELKPEFAQKVAQQIAIKLSRVGVDEYELYRMKRGG